jgi:hypothetical protein
MPDSIITPYATAMKYYTGDVSSLHGEYEGQRLASYDLYDDLFNNLPETATLLIRGTDDRPVLVPTAKRMINTLSRYVGKNWTYLMEAVSVDEDGDPVVADAEAVEDARRAMESLFRRERLEAKFHTGKKAFLRRGDWCWMISADPEKLPGRRITVQEIDPRTYFPLQTDIEDLSRLTGCEIREEILEGEDVAIKVQRWIKAGHVDYAEGWDGDIGYECLVYAAEDFDTAPKVLRVVAALEALPGVKALPVYHIKNNEEGGDPYGHSDLAGLESVLAGVNQAASDEDLALAIAGLGMYWTDAGAPVDEDGEPSNWNLGPAEVVEVGAGGKFERVQGISSVEPSQTHIKFLQTEAYGTVGISDVAMGTASQVEAGVSLALKLSPVFDAADEKDRAINGVWTQLLHDLRDWFAVYEGTPMDMVDFTSVTSSEDRMPFDREARFTELMELFKSKLVSISFVHNELNARFGYTLDSSEAEAAIAAVAQLAAANDPYAARGNAELEDEDETL